MLAVKYNERFVVLAGTTERDFLRHGDDTGLMQLKFGNEFDSRTVEPCGSVLATEISPGKQKSCGYGEGEDKRFDCNENKKYDYLKWDWDFQTQNGAETKALYYDTTTSASGGVWKVLVVDSKETAGLKKGYRVQVNYDGEHHRPG